MTTPATRTRAPALSPRLRALVNQAQRSREQQVREIVNRCRRLYPRYRTLAGSGLESFRRNVRHLVTGFYQRGLIEGRAPAGAELDTPVQAARQRAAQGVPLADMIGCYLHALPILWERLIASAGAVPAVRLELLQRVPLTFSAMSLVITVVTEAYVDERARLSRSRERALDELARLLLAADVAPSVLESRIRALGLRLDAPRTVVLFRAGAASPPERVGREVDAVERLLAEALPATHALTGRLRDGVLVLLAGDPDPKRLAAVVRKVPDAAWRVGIGEAAEGAAGIRRSAHEAQRAIDLGLLLRMPERIHRYADVAVLDLVGAGSPQAREFARRVLGPLARRGASGTDRDTLRAVCRHGHRLKPAAADLGIHPHTLSYRLRQIRGRLGIDLEDPDTRLRVHLALLILEAADDTAG